MPQTRLFFYREDDGSVPVLDWLVELSQRDRRAYLKCRELIGRLAMMGHDLRRPSADLLESGIHKLRARVGRVNYRVLYFFHGRQVAVLAHALTKEQAIPHTDLRRAIERKQRFLSNPTQHTHEETTS